MDITDLEEKKDQLLNKYRNLFIQRTGFTGNMLDNYVTNLIALGEQQYGSNFTEDILKEKREDSILWLMDEVSKHGGVITASSNNVVKDTLQETAHAFAAVANQNAEQQEVNEKDKILELIDKMNENEFENYLKELSWSSSNYAKFNGIVSYKISQNPNKSEFEISKEVLKSMANEIELIVPKAEKNNSAIIDDTLNVTPMVPPGNTLKDMLFLKEEQEYEKKMDLFICRK